MKGEFAGNSQPEYDSRPNVVKTPPEFGRIGEDYTYGTKTVHLGNDLDPRNIGTFVIAEPQVNPDRLETDKEPHDEYGKYDVSTVDFRLVPDTEFSGYPDKYLTLEKPKPERVYSNTDQERLFRVLDQGEEATEKRDQEKRTISDLEDRYKGKSFEKNDPGKETGEVA
jgi:hypothetical protein